jgi:ketosteroid isomerase-like protein
VDVKEQMIRELYEARARRDWDAVGALLAEEIIWHEPDQEEVSGDTRGRGEVVSLLQRLVEVTEDTFQLEPEAFLNAEEYSAVLVRWWAERQGQRSEGNEIAVYRFRDGKIDGVWFYPDGYEPGTFSAVFAFD